MNVYANAHHFETELYLSDGSKRDVNAKFVFRVDLSELNLQIKGGLESAVVRLTMVMKLAVPSLLSSRTKCSLSLAMI